MTQQQRHAIQGGIGIALLLGVVQGAGAATALPGLNDAINNMRDIFFLIAVALFVAGGTSIVYTQVRNRHGLPWDEGLSLLSAGAIAGGIIVIAGWVGLSFSATLHPPSAQILRVALPDLPPEIVLILQRAQQEE